MPTRKAPVSKTQSKNKNLKNEKHQILENQLKKSNESRKQLQKKLITINSEWMDKVKQIEQTAFEKARVALEKEYLKKEEARQKAIASAVANFEKHYKKIANKKNSTKKAKIARKKAVA